MDQQTHGSHKHLIVKREKVIDTPKDFDLKDF
jgi:hypothetical protein